MKEPIYLSTSPLPSRSREEEVSLSLGCWGRDIYQKIFCVLEVVQVGRRGLRCVLWEREEGGMDEDGYWLGAERKMVDELAR